MRADTVENLKRAWLHVARNRFLWPIAFFIALAGGGLQSFSLWIQSPLGTGLAGSSPVHRISEAITDYARGNTVFWVLFVGAGVGFGLMVMVLGAFAHASAIGGVADLEFGREAGFRGSLDWGRRGFARLFLLMLGYVLALGLLSLPFYVLTMVFRSGLVFPCVAWLVLAAGFVMVSVPAGIVLELSARELVLDGLDLTSAVLAGWRLFRDEWRDCLLAWLYVMLISLSGAIVTGVTLALLATPLVPLFNAASRDHNPLLVGLSMVALVAAWALAAAISGIFAVTASAMWTESFLEIGAGQRIVNFTT